MKKANHNFPAAPRNLRLIIDGEVMEKLKAEEQCSLIIEVDAFPSGMLYENPNGGAPILSFLLLAVEAESGFILCTKLYEVGATVEDSWERVPGFLFTELARHSVRPAQINVKTPWLEMLLHPPCDALSIEIKRVAQLPSLREARKLLRQMMRK
ncbi:MAG: hypothetical protein M5U15_15290 [Kiritimatiellae bacterium]|nr:hypothetical protein [Kiritimatiellia bacterium]